MYLLWSQVVKDLLYDLDVTQTLTWFKIHNMKQ